jgi:hypothetical protein
MLKVVRVGLLLLLLAQVAGLVASCAMRTVSVRLEVSGTAARTGITYRNATGATEQRDVTAPWSYEFQAKTGDLLTLRAVNRTAEGTVKCRILIDGQLFKEGESTGPFKFVDCSGLIPLPTPTPR